MPHFCSLPGILQELTENLVQLTLDNMFDMNEDYNYIMNDPDSSRCLLNASMSFIQEQSSAIQSSLENHLEDMSLMSQSLEVARQVLDVMRHYTFTSSCERGLVHMRYCSICGGYGNFRPCLSMCTNTLKGCFADLAEMHSGFTRLIAAMQEVSDDLLNQLSPEHFTDSYMNQFVVMIEELMKKEDDLTEAVSLKTKSLSNESM